MRDVTLLTGTYALTQQFLLTRPMRDVTLSPPCPGH